MGKRQRGKAEIAYAPGIRQMQERLFYDGTKPDKIRFSTLLPWADKDRGRRSPDCAPRKYPQQARQINGKTSDDSIFIGKT